MINALSIEPRIATTSNYGRFIFMCVNLDINHSDMVYTDSVAIPVDFRNKMEGSLFISSVSETNNTLLSPITIGNRLDFENGAISLKRNYVRTWSIHNNDTDRDISSNEGTSNLKGGFIVALHTLDGYTAYHIRYFTDLDNYTVTYCTDNKLGYYLCFGFTSGTSFGPISPNQYLNLSNDLYNISEPYIPDTDPYVDGGGSSGGGGGEGNFDDTSDTISIPSLPSISGLNTGFFTAFVCTQTQLQSVSNYLWTNVIDDILDTSTGLGEKVDALKKMVTSPYDAIMGCSLVPVSPPTGGSKEMKMYGVIKTGISLPYASSRWVEVDCGTLNIHEFWGSYLDYSPYTKTTSLYLPYIGVVSVDIDLIMAKALQVVYHVDILSGICIAYIVVDGSVKFQYQGHCSTTIPVTSSDYSGAIQSGLGLVGNIANVVSSGVSGGLSGGLGGAVLGATGSAISQAPSVASNVMGMKPDIKSGGGVGSSGGILGVQKPFLIIERPKQSVPAFQNGFSGYPCNMTKKLSDLTGYTEIERINLTNISLTEDEKNELLEILESGVYL